MEVSGEVADLMLKEGLRLPKSQQSFLRKGL